MTSFIKSATRLAHSVLPGLILLALSFSLHAQKSIVTRDLHLWTGASIEKTIDKDWTFSLREEFRFKKDISEINNHFTQMGLRYRISKNLAMEGAYRLTWDQQEEKVFEARSRYNFDLRYKGQLSFLTFYYRVRYQKEIKGTQIFRLQQPYEKYLRNRISLRYNKMGSVKPYISGEIFQLFEPNHYPEYEYIRLLLGLRYDRGSFGEFNLAYGMNRDFKTVLPATIYLIKLTYTYSY